MTGSGTQGDPYIVMTLDDLDDVRDDLNAWYELGADIDASVTATWNDGYGWTPIGTALAEFYGNFDGKGHTITGLTSYFGADFTGLFGVISTAQPGADTSGILKDIKLVNCVIYGANYVGALAGKLTHYFGEGAANWQTLALCSGCTSSGTVEGDDYVGGLIGYLFRTITAPLM